VKSLFERALWTFRRNQRRIASSGLFDQSWYVANNPDAPMFPGGPLRHFMRKGARALRDPNPFFDAASYSAQNPEARANPLVHYLRRGAAQGLRPSQEFDPAWYLASYPDVAAAGMEPLSHFLSLGRAEGRLPTEPDVSSIDEAKLVCLKRPTTRETMALFVTHASGREVKPHVPRYLAALAREGVSTVLIVAADKPEAFVSQGLSNLVDGLYLRQNGGYDFAAWAHVARDFDFSRANCLFLLNDSVVGPTNAERFSTLMARIRASDAQLIGLTESEEITRHFQSYFLVAKGEGVATMLDYLAEVKSYPNKHAVIIAYEVPLLRRFLREGRREEALFTLAAIRGSSLEEWHALLQLGMPFVKVSALRSAPGNWRDTLQCEGYDPRLAEGALSAAEPPKPASDCHVRPRR
jgi:Rhamnan synthesis protein F